MHTTPMRPHLLTSGQARRAARMGHPEMSIECPQCHATVGRTCFMKPGFWGVCHTIRKEKYHQQLQADRNPAQEAIATNRR